MKKLLFIYSLFALVLGSCSKEEEIITPPAPNKYTLTITAEAGGSVSSQGGTYNEGSKITITATPDKQYLFEKWSDGSIVNPREITVTSNLTLSATFVKKTYPLSVTVEGEGTVQEEVIIQGSTSETTYNAGTTVRLTATPNEGWVFAGWSGDVESEELVIEVSIEKGTSVIALFQRILFSSKSPLYSYPNSTSGELIANYFFPGDKVVSGELWRLFKGQEANWFEIENETYNLTESGVNFLDLKNDGLLDMVGFLANSNFDTSPGFFFILEDVFGEKLASFYATESWVVPRYEVNDINGDEIMDVIAFTSNSHSDINGDFKTEDLPVKIYQFDQQGNFNSYYVGDAYSLHDGATGDVDNDGDVDVLIWGSKGPFPPNDIGFLINDGNGVFQFKTDGVTINNSKINKSFQSLAHRLVDLDNDGCLDIIAGCFFDEDWVSSQQTLAFGEEGLGAYNYSVYWGSCNGTYILDIETSNFTTVLPNSMIDDLDIQNNYIVLGENVLDFDLDGDLDIITIISSQSYDQFYIQAITNNLGRMFEDNTINVISNNYGNGVFYRIRINDIDNDGDYDLIPFQRDELTMNFYWENTGGSFTVVNTN